MCGRYRLSRRKQLIQEYFDTADEVSWEPRYNIAPSQPVGIIRQDPWIPERRFSLARWGLIPPWATDASIGFKTINARAETVASKPAFRDAFTSRRCLLPADGFFERSHRGREKQPFHFGMQDLLMFAGVAHAQVANKKSLTLDGAARVIAAAEVEAKKSGGTAVIAVVDDGGNLMALQRLDGTFAAGANISIGKARTAVQFKKPTKFFEDVIKNGRTAMVTVDFTPLQGGVPIIYEGEVIGGVGVSGAANAQEDEAVAIAGAKAITEPQQSSAAPKIDYFDRGKVDAAFSKGAVLFDGSDGRNYMVHASRRDGPGMAEVHSLDADIIYVLGGNADLITGGTVQAPRKIAANEIRGDAIVGGDERHLAKGDVIIVPHGVPHWFRQVDAPFTYYVVKVR